jgi:hypothetical protein
VAELTKIISMRAPYQVWNKTDLSNGDIVDVYTSLGGRPAHSVTIENNSASGSATADATIRFNVVQKIYKEHGFDHNSWVGQGAGLGKASPYLVDEVELPRDDIVVKAGTSQQWLVSEIAVTDIKIIALSDSLRILVT